MLFKTERIYQKLLEMKNSGGCGMHYFPDQNLFFLHLSKTGGTSIHKTLIKYFSEVELTEKRLIELSNTWIDTKSLVVIRNIYTKIISEYNHIYKNGYKPGSFNRYLKTIKNEKKIQHPTNEGAFSDFGNKYNELSQKVFITLNESIFFNNVINFENFESDLKTFYKKIKIDEKEAIKKLNVNNEKIFTELNKKQKEKVYQIFKDDIDYFGW